MNSINIKPRALLQEMRAFNEKLSKGARNLSQVGAIPTGVTPYETVYTDDKLALRHYRPDPKPAATGERNPTPLLVVYALVNRPYMADLQENRSTIRGLMAAGQDVYLIDWGYPDAADRYLTLDDYIHGYIDDCVEVLRRRHGVERVNMLGICQGGTFSLCYSATHARKVRNLVTMVTPVDFHTSDNTLSHWVRNVDIDLLVETQGNISGEALNWTFLGLKPYSLMGQKYLGILDAMDDPVALQNFLRMEKWIFDSPDQAGEAYGQFIKDFYQQNKLVSGELVIGGHAVRLQNITMPVLNIYAKQDHLVPPAASRALKQHVGAKDYTELAFPGGHIGIYVGGKANKTIPPAIGEWLNKR